MNTHEEVLDIDDDAEEPVQLVIADLLQVGHVGPQLVVARSR